MRAKDFEKIFNDYTAIGRIIVGLNEVEWELSLILTRYYTAQERFKEFDENIIARFGLQQKIEILTNLKLPKKYISQERVINSLKKIKKVRNLLAHSYLPHTNTKFQKLIQDSDIKRIFKDFPNNFNKEIADTKKRINALYRVYLTSKKKNMSE